MIILHINCSELLVDSCKPPPLIIQAVLKRYNLSMSEVTNNFTMKRNLHVHYKG